MKKIVILISGQGSNMDVLAQACIAQTIPAQVVAVISNRAEAKGLARAAELGIATEVVSHQAYASRDDFDVALAAAIDKFEPDLVVLAGFMRVLGHQFVSHYAGRLLNIHPSLLPSFPGLHTHRHVLAAGVKIHGATVHFVTADLDHGPIVIQAAVPVYTDDTETSLAARVLEKEHYIYPQAVRWFVQNQIQLHGDRVVVTSTESQAVAW